MRDCNSRAASQKKPVRLSSPLECLTAYEEFSVVICCALAHLCCDVEFALLLDCLPLTGMRQGRELGRRAADGERSRGPAIAKCWDEFKEAWNTFRRLEEYRSASKASFPEVWKWVSPQTTLALALLCSETFSTVKVVLFRFSLMNY
jgi:hypothetical protein